ncbi:MAG: pentapeptide repeat-containing protein [Oscillibacter sp.]|nr:pentapeptide repeat-containing protein [Oscillibacter sp.]
MNSPGQALRTALEEGESPSLLCVQQEELAGLDAGDAVFRQVQFRRCRFTDCDFSAAAFYDCVFESCAFTGCRFAVSFWKGTALRDCKAQGGDFRRARFKDCVLDHLRLPYANFTEALWERCALTDCDLTESTCQELKVVKTTLTAANFTGTVLFRALLKGIDLSGCTLDGITLSASCQELRGAKIHAVQAALVARILGIEIAD